MLIVIFVKIDQKILLLKTWVYMLSAGKAERRSFPCQSRRAGVLQEKGWLQKEEKGGGELQVAGRGEEDWGGGNTCV